MDTMDTTAIPRLQQEIATLENALSEKKRQLDLARAALAEGNEGGPAEPQAGDSPPAINNRSSPEAKIALFRSLFRGREDVYAKRFESKKTRNAGYQPVWRNEWVKGVCGKPKTKCGASARRDFEPLSDTAIRNHFAGFIRGEGFNIPPLGTIKKSIKSQVQPPYENNIPRPFRHC